MEIEQARTETGIGNWGMGFRLQENLVGHRFQSQMTCFPLREAPVICS